LDSITKYVYICKTKHKIMTNGNIPISELTIERKQGVLLYGHATVNGQKVSFYYNPQLDKFQATTLLNSEADLYMSNPPRNWMYLVCGSIAHSIKNR